MNRSLANHWQVNH